MPPDVYSAGITMQNFKCYQVTVCECQQTSTSEKFMLARQGIIIRVAGIDHRISLAELPGSTTNDYYSHGYPMPQQRLPIAGHSTLHSAIGYR